MSRLLLPLVALALALPARADAPDPAFPPLPERELDALRDDLERFGKRPPAEGDPYDLGATTVQGERPRSRVPSSEFRITLGDLGVVPRKNAGDQLMLAPGVLTTNPGGEGHAQEIFFRGFAANEGKDIEFIIDGVPINDVSNTHTHGYADLFFLPPEVVEAVEVAAGPFDPVQGDFAFAGTGRYRLGVAERGSRVQYGLGSWNSHRALLLVAPEGEDPGTFGVMEFTRSFGFGPNRASQRANAMGRYARDEGDWRWSAMVSGFATRFDQPGVVREDDLQQGRVGFFHNYDPNQDGESSRLLANFAFEAGRPDARVEAVTFFGTRAMRLRHNFTGWLLDPEALLGGRQRGDGLEQRYSVMTLGHRGSYRLAGRAGGLEQALAIGWSARYDRGEATSLRIRPVTAIPWDTELDRAFDILNLSGWLRSELAFTDWLRLRGGARLDTFLFGVTDLNQPTTDRDGARVDNQRAASMGFAVNPRVTVEVDPAESLRLTASYGQGTRSTEAAALSDNETTPFARSQQLEAGARWQLGRPGDDWQLEAQAAYVYAEVTQDLLFDEGAGRNILVGATTRHAALFGLRARAGGFFDGLLNVGWTQGTFDATGERLPYIPEWVVRLDTALTGQLFDWQISGVPVTGRLGLGFTFVPGRPLPFRTFGDDFWLLDLRGEVRLWHISVGLELRNLFDRRYRQSEFNFASNFVGPDVPPSRMPMRHFVAGEPFFAMLTFTLHLESALRGLFEAEAEADAEVEARAPGLHGPAAAGGLFGESW